MFTDRMFHTETRTVVIDRDNTPVMLSDARPFDVIVYISNHSKNNLEFRNNNNDPVIIESCKLGSVHIIKNSPIEIIASGSGIAKLSLIHPLCDIT